MELYNSRVQGVPTDQLALRFVPRGHGSGFVNVFAEFLEQKPCRIIMESSQKVMSRAQTNKILQKVGMWICPDLSKPVQACPGLSRPIKACPRPVLSKACPRPVQGRPRLVQEDKSLRAGYFFPDITPLLFSLPYYQICHVFTKLTISQTNQNVF